MSPFVVDSDKIAVLHAARRVWAIASVHGDAARLRAIHRAIAARFEAGDRLVYLGNLIGRGPDSADTLDAMLEFRRAVIGAHGMFASDVAILRGAQEEMWQKLQQLQLALDPADVLAWMLDQGVGATLEAYGASAADGMAAARAGAAVCARWTADVRDRFQAHPGHAQILSALRRAAVSVGRDDGAQLLFVSAGIDTSRPLATQKDSFWWPPCELGRVTEPYGEFARVVGGFDPAARGVVEAPFTVSLDGGSGRGGALVAGCFSSAGALIDTIEA
jgi:hypothetical protein